MKPFTTLTGVAAPLPFPDVDTDKIIPARFMKTILRSGLGVNLFDALRYDDQGREIADFVLNRIPYRDAQILVTLDNFGCGSSREHAPWALLDFGIRCLIAPSFADIFASNCTKNGILPITLGAAVCQTLLDQIADPQDCMLTVDLEQCVISSSKGKFDFSVDKDRRHRLLNGIDDIAETLLREDAIRAYELRNADRFPPDIAI
jgi:3-isopropylmalate/(R)-2-methylmalate dehydratase small subunit